MTSFCCRVDKSTKMSKCGTQRQVSKSRRLKATKATSIQSKWPMMAHTLFLLVRIKRCCCLTLELKKLSEVWTRKECLKCTKSAYPTAIHFLRTQFRTFPPWAEAPTRKAQDWASRLSVTLMARSACGIYRCASVCKACRCTVSRLGA